MNKTFLLSIILWIVCGGCLFLGYQRYRDYQNSFSGKTESTILQMGFDKDRHIPDQTKYALIGAAISGLAAAACLVASRR